MAKKRPNPVDPKDAVTEARSVNQTFDMARMAGNSGLRNVQMNLKNIAQRRKTDYQRKSGRGM